MPRKRSASAGGARSPVVGILMGSDSDLPTLQEAAKILEEFGVPFELRICSAHRTPERLVRSVVLAGAEPARAASDPEFDRVEGLRTYPLR